MAFCLSAPHTNTHTHKRTYVRARAYTLKTPVRLRADAAPVPTRRNSDSPQLLACHYFEEASLSFTSYSS